MRGFFVFLSGSRLSISGTQSALAVAQQQLQASRYKKRRLNHFSRLCSNLAVRRGLEVRSTRAITIENKTPIIAQPQLCESDLRSDGSEFAWPAKGRADRCGIR